MQKLEIKNQDHLGLVAQYCREIKLIETVDQLIPSGPDKHLSWGQLLQAMIINGLGFSSRTLHMFPQFFADKPVEALIGEGITAEQINDKALGRALDKFYDCGVNELFSALSIRCLDSLGLKPKGYHLDSTTFHVDGRYDRESDSQAITLSRGYSRDHRPELKQAVLALLCEGQAGIPVHMQTASGHQEDKRLFRAMLDDCRQAFRQATTSPCLVADAALYTKDTLQALDAENTPFITRVPATLKDCKAAIRQDVPLTQIAPGYQGYWLENEYGGVSQRWLVVRSEKARQAEHSRFETSLDKALAQAKRSLKALCQRRFTCEQDAISALDNWEAAQKLVCVHKAKVIHKDCYEKPGKPTGAADYREYRLEVEIELHQHKVEQARAEKGWFVLATNQTDLSMEDILTTYKQQQRVERGFRFLKSPDFLTSAFYVKKPQRLEALLMVMTCCLMVYAGLEYKIRQRLEKSGSHFPDMKKKPTQTPTALWVFRCFGGLHRVHQEGASLGVVNLNAHQVILLEALGPDYQSAYS